MDVDVDSIYMPNNIIVYNGNIEMVNRADEYYNLIISSPKELEETIKKLIECGRELWPDKIE